MTQPIIDKTVAVVGAGPIGLEMAVALRRAGVDYVLLEARQLGHTISWWPRGTHFFSTPERIAIAGVPLQTTEQIQVTNEQYLAYLRGVAQQFGVRVNAYEPVLKVERVSEGFRVATRAMTGERTYACRYVVLATGGMDAPNRLGIPGEDLPHVTHYLNDPHRYFQQRLLVVGGRNSALEAVMRCWRAGAEVTLSHRGLQLERERIKKALLEDLDTVLREEKIGYLPGTELAAVEPGWATLVSGQGERFRREADFVLLCTGFVADMSLFEGAGVRLRGELQVPEYDPETMETNIPGLFVAGTAAGGTQRKYVHFIETSHVHVKKIFKQITGNDI